LLNSNLALNIEDNLIFFKLHVYQEQLTGEKVGLAPTTPSFVWILFFFFLGGGTFLGLNYLLFDYKITIPIVSLKADLIRKTLSS